MADNMFRSALRADAFSVYEINVTKNQVVSGASQNDDVYFMSEGATVPGDLVANTAAWAKRIVSGEANELIQMLDPANLLVMYEIGERSPWIEYRVKDRHGQDVWLHETINLSKDEETGDVVGLIIMKDITAQKTVERENLRRLRLIEGLTVDYASVYLADLTHDRYEIYRRDIRISKKYGKCFLERYSASMAAFAAVGVAAEDQELFLRRTSAEDIRRRLTDAASTRFIFRAKSSSRTAPVHYRAKIVRVASDPGAENVFACLIGFANVEDELRAEHSQREALENALDQARQASAAKTAFLSNMSHDIRTPMNAIVGFAEIASEHPDDPETVRHALEKIRESGDHLLRLINNVLDMSHLESGRFNLDETVSHIPEIIRAAVDMVQPEAARKKIRLHVNIVADADRPVYSDRLRVSQILLNLLANAVKYTGSGGDVWVDVLRKRIAPRGYMTLEITVADNGIGMSPEFTRHVFEPFEREDRDEVNHASGSGLGLSICRGLVDSMGGTIAVHSVVGEGSSFVVRIPFKLALGDEDENPENEENTPMRVFGREETEREDAADPDELRGMRVLIVEDNALNREIAEELLRCRGIETASVENGKLAIEELVSAGRGTYQAVIMDIRMPVMDGLEAARRIRNIGDREIAEIPIIAMTANAFAQDALAARDAGMDAYIAKPINIDKLMRALRAVTEDQKKNISM